MEDFKVDILSINKRGRLYFRILIVCIIVIIAVLVILQIVPIAVQVFSIVAWLLAVVKYFLQSKKQVLKKSVGDLTISKKSISVYDNEFALSSLHSIKLCIKGWKSYSRSADRNQPIANLHAGDKNFIWINAHGKNVKCEFLLTSKEHWHLLRQHVIGWYCHNINISEENDAGRTYGLQNLNYKEIQQFKQHIQDSKKMAI